MCGAQVDRVDHPKRGVTRHHIFKVHIFKILRRNISQISIMNSFFFVKIHCQENHWCMRKFNDSTIRDML